MRLSCLIKFNIMEITYSFNSILFKDHGVFVANSEGIIGTPKRKEPEKYDYPNENGYVVDLTNKVYEARVIKLDCIIKGASSADLIDKYNLFTKSMQDIDETKTLSVSVDAKSLSFLCYVSDITQLKKRFTSGVNYGTFTLTFIEPNPIIV